MTNEEEDRTRARVRTIIMDLAPNPQGGSSDNPNLASDFEYHSLALLELAFALEDEFGLPALDERTALEIETAQDVERYVLTAMKAAASPTVA